MKFSTQKYSSNIIEKCMDCCDEETKEIIIHKYCEPYIIERLLFDMYGNYVLQKVMSLSKEPVTTKYISIVGPLMKKLNTYSFGVKLYNKLLSSFPALSSYVGNKNEVKLKKMKTKKNNNSYNIHKNDNNNGNNNINTNTINSNIYNRIQMINMMNNQQQNNMNNKFQNNLFPQGINNNNFFIPFQYNNNNLNNNNPNNHLFLQSLMNSNNFGMNYNTGNNISNFIQFQHNKFNIDNNNNGSNVPNGAQMMFNFNNQQ